MRLIDAKPRWVFVHGWVDYSLIYAIGITFKCPHCEQRLGVMFANPVDPQGLAQKYGWNEAHRSPAWKREGDTFENLTLTPSVNVIGHWHGFITNGVLK